jgi:hypothetical protein
MKRLLLVSLAAMIGFGMAWVFISKNQSMRVEAALREKEIVWQQERDLLASQLIEAQARLEKITSLSPHTEVVEVTKQQSPQEIIALLKTLRIDAKDPKNIRQVIQQLENLIALGESALPEIQTFLATQMEIGNSDISRDTNGD